MLDTIQGNLIERMASNLTARGDRLWGSKVVI